MKMEIGPRTGVSTFASPTSLAQTKACKRATTFSIETKLDLKNIPPF